MADLKIVKRFRQLWKLDDGSGAYERVNSEDEDGTELLIVSPDGSMLQHVIDLPERDQPKVYGPVYPSDLHAERQASTAAAEPVGAAAAVLPPKPAPVQEPVPDVEKPVRKPPPLAPVSPMVADAARQLAATVWGWGHVDRTSHFVGLSTSSVDAWIGHAVAMQWVTVSGDLILKGPLNPNPPAEALSPREARSRWGPNWL